MLMHHVFEQGSSFQSCGVNASCVYQRGSSLKVVVSMHLAFIFKKARSTVEASMHDVQCVFKCIMIKCSSKS